MTGGGGPSLVQEAPPAISDDEATAIAREVFGLSVAAEALGSHQDRNFRLTEEGRAPLLLKVANPATSAEELEAQSAAARLVGLRAPGVRVPRAVGVEGETARVVEHDGHVLHARVLDYLDGRTLSGRRHLPVAAVRGLGELAGQVDVALATFDHPGADRVSQWDLRASVDVLGVLLPHVKDGALRARLRAAAEQAWAAVGAVAADLPLQVIHGDLTDDNVVSHDDVTRVPDGVIDFGDLNRSWTVAELAITVSSLLHHEGVDTIRAMAAVRAYHAVRPLEPCEAAALWPLVVLRGAVLVASGHHVTAADPENSYAADNLTHELTVFDEATSVPLPVATALVRASLGVAVDALRLPDHGPLLADVDQADVVVVDLSAASPALDEGRWLRPDAEEQVIAEALAARPVAMTRFGEPRLTRSAPAARTEPENTPLEVEVAVADQLDVLAPWPGTVELTADGLQLSTDLLVLRLDGVAAEVEHGVEVTRGSVLGSVASRLVVALRRPATAAPRMSRASWTSAWRAVVADPTPLILGHALPDPRADAPALVERRSRSLAEVQEHYYDDPPVMVRGWREHLVDSDARVYLDAVNNVTAIGHAHPRLTRAVAAQWRLLNTNSRFNYPAVVDYADRLADLLPDELDTVFLVNSGSEAVDLALRMARAWSGRADVLAVREAYHGWTDLSDAVSTSVADNPQALLTRPSWVHTLDAPNSFRGTHRGAASHLYAEEAVAEVARLAHDGSPVGAFIAETFYGNAGGIALPDGYLSEVYAAVRAHGGLVIADEVQVGLGRLGHWLWGFEQQGVVPDVVTIAKAAGNGQPLGAVITRRQIADAFRSQGYFFSSAGGSPVSCVAGLAVLDVMRDEGLQENARTVGEHFRARLEELADRHPLIGAVHGSGLYLGAELVRDRESLEPATEETAAICERMRELGVIIQPTSDRQCVLKIKPPLCLTRESADVFVDVLDHVLTTGW